MKRLIFGYRKAAAEFELSERTLRYWVSRGLVPCLRIGHRSVAFEPDKFWAALQRLEIKEVGRPSSRAAKAEQLA